MIASRDNNSIEKLLEIRDAVLQAMFEKTLSALPQEQKKQIREALTIRFETPRKSIEIGEKSEYSANGDYHTINYARTRLEKQLADWEKAIS